MLNVVLKRLLYSCEEPTIASGTRGKQVPGPGLMAAFHLPEFPTEPILDGGYRSLSEQCRRALHRRGFSSVC